MIRKICFSLFAANLFVASTWAQGIVFDNDMRHGQPIAEPAPSKRKLIPVPASSSPERLQELGYTQNPGPLIDGTDVQELSFADEPIHRPSGVEIQAIERPNAVPQRKPLELAPGTESAATFAPETAIGIKSLPQELQPPVETDLIAGAPEASPTNSRRGGVTFEDFSEGQIQIITYAYDTVLSNSFSAANAAMEERLPQGNEGAFSLLNSLGKSLQKGTVINAYSSILNMDQSERLIVRLNSESDPHNTSCETPSTNGRKMLAIAGPRCSLDPNTLCICEAFFKESPVSQWVNLTKMVLLKSHGSGPKAETETKAISCFHKPELSWCQQ